MDDLQDVVDDVEQKMQELFELAVTWALSAHYAGRNPVHNAVSRAHIIGTKHGLIYAYALLSGTDEEAVAEQVDDTVVARVEKAIFDSRERD